MSEKVGFRWAIVYRVLPDGKREEVRRGKSACVKCFTRKHDFVRECRYSEFYERPVGEPIDA